MNEDSVPSEQVQQLYHWIVTAIETFDLEAFVPESKHSPFDFEMGKKSLEVLWRLNENGTNLFMYIQSVIGVLGQKLRNGTLKVKKNLGGLVNTVLADTEFLSKNKDLLEQDEKANRMVKAAEKVKKDLEKARTEKASPEIAKAAFKEMYGSQKKEVPDENAEEASGAV